jgi:co-chaperonin GroES (HSP10)
MARLEVVLNNLLIQEIPAEDAKSLDVIGLDGKEIVTTDKAATKPFLGKVLACGASFPVSGLWVDMPYRPGDIVFTDEFGRNYLKLDPFRGWKKIKSTDTQYYTIRYEDVIGVVREA